jgi:hypothetical protein
MDLHAHVLAELRRIAETKALERAVLEHALRLLAKWRSVLVQNTIVEKCGAVIQTGPFKGMQFARQSTEGCHAAKLLGTYEHELHAHVEAAIARGYGHVVNIGCADGYYAVGLATRMPSARIHAFDQNENARTVCRSVAELNAVADRIEISGVLAGEEFARFPAGDTLVICDIEGAEDALLEPEKFPALRGFDLIVELHECFKAGIARKICSRFEDSHEITLVPHTGVHVDLPQFLLEGAHLDQLLAVWEWRTGPTPWAVMKQKA